MKTSKKLLSLIMVAVMALGLLTMSACGTETASSSDKTAAAATTSAAAGTTAGTPAETGKQITVGISMATTTNNPHVVALANTLVDAVKAKGWTPVLQDADGDSAKQSTQFDNLVTQGVDLIIYWANDANAAVADTKKAADAGIPVISYFIDPVEEAHQYIKAYVGADQYLIATEVAKYMNTLLGGKGKVAIINGKEGKTDFVLRSKGFRDTMATLGTYEIVAEEYSDADRTKAQTIMENYLTTYPDLQAVFVTSDDFGVGAYNAISAAGRTDIKICSIDGQQEVLKLIDEGKWSSTIYQTVAMMADKCVSVAEKVLKGETIDQYNQFTDYYVVTKDNVKEYLAK
ncbi:MAG: sugar ABC transporter substrate-binding protein [Clostridiales bacterium]|nr:sugar ABC transporter substrate-binding protein [Clostridiales bacterium]